MQMCGRKDSENYNTRLELVERSPTASANSTTLLTKHFITI